ncbi:hypothetical protein V1511DRAFT_517796 [Dipodascopsis uninucleata]
MKIKKSPSSVKRLTHMPLSLKEYIAKLESCPLEELPTQIRSSGISWDQPRGDLHHWITVLNRFDDILEDAVTKSGLKSNLPTSYTFSEKDEELIIAVLDFTALLLEHCSHRSLYASGPYLSNLLYVTSLPILISTLKVCARLAQRYAQANSSRGSIFIISQEKMVKLANIFPPPTPVKVTDRVSLYDLLDESKDLDEAWSTVVIHYYKNSQADGASTSTSHLPSISDVQPALSSQLEPPITPSSHHAANTPTHKPDPHEQFTPSSVGATPTTAAASSSENGLMTYFVSAKNVAESSLKSLLEKVFEDIPKEFIVDAFFQTRTVKAFANDVDGLKMRQQLTMVKCLATEFLAYTMSESVIQNRLFSSNPLLIPYLCELIHPDNKAPTEIRTLALEALQALSHHRAKHNEILSSLSANVNHGVLLYIIRQVAKDIEKGDIVDEYFSDRLFSLIQVLASNGHSAQVLVTAGIMPVLIEILDRDSSDFNTLSMTAGISQHMVCISSAAFNEFVQIGGLDIVVTRIEYEVNANLSNPHEIEQSVLVDYKIPYTRAHFLKSLFKLLLSMMQSTGNADRLRNLVESNILSSLKKIIANSTVFGTNIVSCAIDMMSTFIHNEPTSYNIISESKLPQVFLESIPELIELSKTTAIPHAIGAICLNVSGLELVKSTNAIHNYMQVFKMRDKAHIMSLTSAPNTLGSAFDELVRHHPSIKDIIFNEVVDAARKICEEGESMLGGARFFRVGSDDLKTEADEELVVQDDSSDVVFLIDCYSRFLESFTQNNTLCKEFMRRNGLDYLVKFYTLPSLPYDFPSRTPAISLTRVFRLATEVNAYWTVNVILRACCSAMAKVNEFLGFKEDDSFFNHLEAIDNDNATEFMKNLNAVHSFVFLLSQLYAHLIYPHTKSTLPMIQPFTSVPEFEELLIDFGRLERNCLWEDIFITRGLSEEWRNASRVLTFDDLRGRYMDQERKAEIAEAETKVDVTDNRYKNVKIIRYMMSQIPGSLSKIFAGISKLALSRRVPDASQKRHGFAVAEIVAKVLVDNISYDRIDLFNDRRDKYAYWLLLLSASRNILFDDQRVSLSSLQTVVVICFKRLGGIDLLIKVLESLWDEIKGDPEDVDDKSLLSQQAKTFGDVVVLQMFSTLVNIKSVLDASQTTSLATKERERDRPDYFNPSQFLVELRLAVLPAIEKLWSSETTEQASSPILKILIGILASIMSADGETGCISPGDKPWTSAELSAKSFKPTEDGVRQLMDLGYSRPVVETALARSSNQVDRAANLLLVTHGGLSLNTESDTLMTEEAQSTVSASDTDRAVVDTGTSTSPSIADTIQSDTRGLRISTTVVDHPLGSNFDLTDDEGRPETTTEMIRGQNRRTDVPDSDDASEEELESETSSLLAPSRTRRSLGSSGQQTSDVDDTKMEDEEQQNTSSTGKVYVSDLNNIRDEIRTDLVTRALSVLELHADTVFELSNLITSSYGSRSYSAETRKQVFSKLLRHFNSLDSSDEQNAPRIKSTAHLIGLLLQSESFFTAAKEELKANWSLLITLLKKEYDASSSFIPDVLLIIEKILSDAEKPVSVLPDAGADAKVVDLEQIPESVRRDLFDTILTLPAKSDSVAPATARVLAILTRNHEYAVECFEKGAIAMLFNSIQTMKGESRTRMQNSLAMLIRHVVDSPKTLETLMAIEIRNWLSQPRARPVDVSSYIKGNSQVVLRNPETFVKVTNDICKLSIPTDMPPRHQSIILKSMDKKSLLNPEFTDDTESKEQTETDDNKDNSDNIKRLESQPSKVLALEKTTGVIQFLLNELMSTKEDPPQLSESEKTDEEKTGDDNQTPASAENPSKIEFSIEKHPLFMYKMFLLEVLTELVSSYNQCKLEFISYSRRGQAFNTPSKPRLAVLNYFLNDLLSTGTLFVPEDITLKKRFAISNMTVKLLCALISGSGECGPGEEDLTILHIRKFVLDATLRAFKDVSSSLDPLGVKYARLMNLGVLCYKFLNGRANNSSLGTPKASFLTNEEDDKAIAKIMFEKNFVSTLTNAMNDIDLCFPGSQKVVRVLLKPLTKLSRASVELSDILSHTKPGDNTEEDYFSADSAGDDEYREETPNMFTNSALGMYEVEEGMDYDEDESEGSDMEDGAEEMEYDEEVDDDERGSDDEEDTADDEAIQYGDEEMDYGDDDSGDLTEDDEDDDPDDGMDVEIVVTGELPHDHHHGDEDDDDEDDDDDDVTTDEDSEDDNELDDESIQDYEEEDDWQDIEADDIDDFGDGDPIDEIARALGADEETPDQEDMDDEDEDDEDEDDIDEDSDDIMPTDDLDYGDDIDQDGDDGMQYGWEVEEILSYDDAFSVRRQNHLFTNSARGSVISDVDTTINPLLIQPSSDDYLGTGNESITPIRDRGFTTYVHPMERGAGGDLQVLRNLFQHVVRHHHQRLSVAYGTNDLLPHELDTVFGYHHPRTPRQTRHDPWAVIASWTSKSTLVRWQEESRMLFGSSANDKALNAVNHIVNRLMPAAIEEEEQRKAQEAEERQKELDRIKKEEQERQEREEAEKKAAEEAEARRKAEEEEAAAAARAAEEAAAEAEASESAVTAADSASKGDSEMEHVEPSEASAVEDTSSAAENRVLVNIGGREVDVTGLGIDPTFLEALPEEMREEVLTSHIREMQSTSVTNTGGQESEIEAEFLAALPQNIRDELLQHEAAERQRVQREREVRTTTSEPGPADMDFETFLATLDPPLRQTILIEQDEDSLSQLPSRIADEAHELQRRQNVHGLNNFFNVDRIRSHTRYPLHRFPDSLQVNELSSNRETHSHSKNSIQLVDKAGIASLLRLLYLPQSSNQRNPLFDLLVSVSANRQSRTELFNMLLSILQDGSMDIQAVERSFAQISTRARAQHSVSIGTPLKLSGTPRGPVTPQRNTTVSSNDSAVFSVGISPLLFVQQCLQALDYIIKVNRQLASYFLIEHENSIGLKRTLSRKGKSKDSTVLKAQKYPINSLFSLLERPMIRDNAFAMDLLSMIFQEITRPLQMLVKRSQESEDSNTEQKTSGTLKIESGDTVMENTTVEDQEDNKPEQKVHQQQQRKLTPPFIPENNLRLLVNILTAKECPNRTLQQTLAAMQNLSAIPGVKKVFGEELIRQAQELGTLLPQDLMALSSQIQNARSGSEVQGMALARFSPASSDQAKLLRVLTAVDYLFDPEREKSGGENEETDLTEKKSTPDTLIELYSGLNFSHLWDVLGVCLRDIQERSDMLHVATVLLPLIEAFMVVCKHEVMKDHSVKKSEESQMQRQFFSFTDDHRKILNQMVRNNPKLMSGSFSILVKNPKVLDFDNKRNYFNRQLHGRTPSMHIHRPLALNVRRDQVFLDSYKAMYFKSGDEIKYSKLNIRFHGEEGVDAGGVTREWFQVLARQMFNPDYALFTPVASDRTTFHPNRTSGVNPEHLLFFKFIGRIIGKALYEGRVLDCHFSRAVYKRILGKQVSLKDMETLDLEYYKSLVWMLDNDITDVITETMSLEADDYGDKKIIDLIPDGRNIPVTEENKHDFVRLVVEYRLLTSIEEQLDSFLNGFYDIVPKNLISIFNEQELELLISGLPDIDVDDWRNNTVYQNYSPSSPQIQWFWRAVRSFDAEERAKLLQFVTGTSKVPLNGFSELEGMNGVSRFSIHRDYGHKERLPSSHTCFNQLDMPEYDSYESLRNSLLLAITEGREGFGFA